MLDQVLETFEIVPDYDLDIMGKNQSLQEITSKILANFDPVVKKEQPDLVLVHGDTTTTFAAGLVAFYNKVSIGHVEAGLRTYDKYSPYPEEMNRQMTDSFSDLYFAPTQESKANLLSENQELFEKIQNRSILTPHIIEFSRLTGFSSNEILRLRWGWVDF